MNVRRKLHPTSERKPLWRCQFCEAMSKARLARCLDCNAFNGYVEAPAGSHMPRAMPKHYDYEYEPRAGASGACRPLAGQAQEEAGAEDFGFGFGDDSDEGSISGDAPDRARFIDPQDDEEGEAVAIGKVVDENKTRLPTGIKAFDKVLGGGGIVLGSSALLEGAPGAGKSTLVLQVAAKIASRGIRVLYATGEESAADIKARCQRVGLWTRRVRKFLLVSRTTSTDKFAELLEQKKPQFAVLDSVQMFKSRASAGAAGSEEQAKYLSEQVLVGICKPNGIALILVSQVNKKGEARGTMTVPHLGDAHLWLKLRDAKDPHSPYRVLGAKKNRNGPANVTGVVKMGAKGLVSVKDKVSDPGQTPKKAQGLRKRR